MKNIFTADIHLQDFSNDKIITEDGISLKLLELLTAFENMCKYATENKIRHVYIGGDINHKKNIISARSFIKFKKILDYYSNLEFFFIKGNHDTISHSGEESAVDLLSGPLNVYIIRHMTTINNITFIPDGPELYNNLQKANSNDILISHLPLSDAKTDTGLNIDTHFSKKDFKKFKLVLLGDYHTPQSVDHIHYSGTLIPFTRAETEEKSFIVFDDETLDIERIPTTGYRKYYDIELTEKTNSTEILETIKELSDAGNFITLRQKTKDIPEELKNVLEIAILDNQYEEEHISRGITSGMNLNEQIEKYVEIMNVPKKLKDKYFSIIIDILERK